MIQLKPSLGEGQFVFRGIGAETLSNFAELRIFFDRNVSGKHDRCMALTFHMSVRNHVGCGRIIRDPLGSTRRAFGFHPVEAKQVIQVVCCPLGWSDCPGAFQATARGIFRMALATFVFPAKALFFDVGRRRFCAYTVSWLLRSVGFTEGVTTGNQRNNFFVIHRHTTK